MKVILKLKDDVSPKVRSVGMHLGNHRVEIEPKEFDLKESEEFLLNTNQFKFYMEIVTTKLKKKKRSEDQEQIDE